MLTLAPIPESSFQQGFLPGRWKRLEGALGCDGEPLAVRWPRQPPQSGHVGDVCFQPPGFCSCLDSSVRWTHPLSALSGSASLPLLFFCALPASPQVVRVVPRVGDTIENQPPHCLPTRWSPSGTLSRVWTRPACQRGWGAQKDASAIPEVPAGPEGGPYPWWLPPQPSQPHLAGELSRTFIFQPSPTFFFFFTCFYSLRDEISLSFGCGLSGRRNRTSQPPSEAGV